MNDTMPSVLELVNVHLEAESRDAVARTAIEVGLDNRDTAGAGFFFEEVDRCIRVKGFRKSSAAPLDMLARAVSRRLPGSPFLALSAIALWALSKPDLRDSAVQAVQEAGVVTDFGEMPEDLSVEDITLAVGEQLPRVRALQPEASEDELWLVLLAVMYFDLDFSLPKDGALEATLAPSGPDESEEPLLVDTTLRTAGDLHSDIFNRWLTDLASLDCQASEWAEARQFGEQVCLLAERKRDEAHQARRAGAVLDQLKSIRGRHAETLETFGLELSLDAVPEEQVVEMAAASAELGELSDLLDRYADLLALPVPRLLAERQAHRSEEEVLEARIGEVLDRLPTGMWATAKVDDAVGVTSENAVHEDAAEAAMQPEGGDAESDTYGSGALERDVDILGNHQETEKPEGKSPPPEHRKAGHAASDGENASAAPDEVEGSIAVADFDLSAEVDLAADLEPDDDDVSGVYPTESQAPADYGDVATRDLAERLGEQDEDVLWSHLVASLVAQGDAPGAYWITRSLEEQGRPLAVPSWLLAAYQGSLWLATDSPLAWDLKAIVTANVLGTDDTSQLLALAAGLKSVLLEPQTGMAAWLQDASPAAARFGLLDLVNAVRQYTVHCPLAVRPEYLVGIADEEAREDAIRAAISEAGGWMERAQLLQAGYQRATAVWRRLVSKGGDLALLMAPVLKDDRSGAADVRTGTAQWMDGEYVDRRVAELVDQMYGGGANEIEAHAAGWLRRRAAETCAYATRWCDIAGNASGDSRNVAWIAERIEELRSAVDGWLVNVPAIVNELSCHTASKNHLACACLEAIAGGLSSVLQLRGRGFEPTSDQSPVGMWWAADAADLEQMLAKRLLWCPELDLENDCIPDSACVAAIADEIREAIVAGRTLSEAVAAWTRVNRDFRFLDRYLIGGLSPLADDEALVVEMHGLQDVALAELRGEAGRTAEVLEQSVVDNFLEEAERAAYDSRLQEISAPLTGDGPVENSYNVGRCLDELGKLRRAVDSRRKEHLKNLADRWSLVRKSVLDSYPAKEARPVVELVERALDEADIVLLNECVPELERTVDKKAPLEPGRFVAPEREDVLDVFNASRDSIRSWATGKLGLRQVLVDIESKHQMAGIAFGSLSDPMHKEVQRAVSAWRELKRNKGAAEEARRQLPVLAQYLGFELLPVDGHAVIVRASKADWLHASGSMTAGDRARPIPLYGSKSNNRYDLVCLWERPGMVSLGSRIQELGIKNRPVVVFYFGHLSDLQRLELVQSARARHMPVAVLDETLMLFLSRCRDVRLSDFLACAIPYAALNPYTPGVAGNVPPEMYFGREHMADELENQHGSCLVYGGRQLGKSALLRRVAARFNRPKDEQYAAVHEIKLVGERLSGEESSGIWRHLHEAMTKLGLIDRKYKGPEELARTVREVMDAVPQRRVIVMFDEADNFLHDDSRGNYSQLTRLKALMEDTDRRFKLVFAGLQEVQRFKQLPNHPLAHLGEPILVGALEPEVARRLVRGPTDVLGYRMSNPVVLRVLSYTNYHPGLLQLFCSALVDRLQKRQVRALPPYEVALEDVETVFRQDLRKEIRKRFDWTLELDSRYQAIAWSMIADQLERRDGYSRGYTPRQIRELAGSWWASGFDDVQDDSMAALLTELCGLNILVEERLTDGSRLYRLRSPNLVRLMGTGEDLETRLLELGAGAGQGQPVDLGAIHLWIDGPDEEGFFSPLTRAQEAQVAKPESGVGIVHGSNALGLARAEEAVRALVPRDLPSAEFAIARIPETVSSGEGARRWLREFVRRHREQRRLIAWGMLGTDHGPITIEVVESAIAFCETKRVDPSQWLRVILFLDPYASRVWMESDPGERLKLEQRADVVTWLRPLTTAGIAQRLNRFDMISGSDACAAIFEATGGWTALVDRCIDDARATNDSGASADRIRDALSTGRGDLRIEFEEAVGLAALPAWRELMTALYSWLPEYEREVATLSADDLGCHAWRGEDSTVLLQRLGLVRLDADGRLARDVVVTQLLKQ